jgi:hypothetical protein
MMKSLFIFISALLLLSCGSVNLQNGANAIASTFKSQSIEVGKSFATDTDHGEVNALTIDLGGVENIDKDSYPMNKVASVSAKLLFDNISRDDIGQFDQVIVNIKSRGETSEFRFGIEDLAKIDDFIIIANNYISAVTERKYDELVNFTDTLRLSTTDHLDMINYYLKNDSIMGLQEKIIFTGFAFETIKLEADQEIVELWAETSAKDYTVHYHFKLNNDGKEIKIWSVGIK